MNLPKAGGRNPPDPVERRPEPTPAPLLSPETLDVVASLTESFGKQLATYKSTVERLRAELERIPCVSQYCVGPEHHIPDARDGLPNARCHRCQAVRLAKGALDNG